MKITFDPPRDSQLHMYCMHCLAEAVTRHAKTGQGSVYRCAACGHNGGRAIIIDPAVVWWLDQEKEYWHEVAGVFVCNGGEYLFFERVEHPVGVTIPAGHRDVAEDPAITGMRELLEETSLKVSRLTHIATQDMWGDECHRGADAHRWHIYKEDVPSREVSLSGAEGIRPIWLTLEEALKRNLVPVVRQIIARHGRKIHAAAG